MADEIDQVGRIFAIMDGESGRKPDGLGIFAQQPRTDGVERAGPGYRVRHHRGFRNRTAPALRKAGDDAADTVCHLGGRSPGECQQHDAPRIGAALDQMSDPMGERGGLARSGAGNDEKRPRFEAEPAAMFGGTTLLWIEVFQARPLPSATDPTGFSDRAAARGGRGLESVRTELGLNHDSPFVRNVVMCDVARPGRFVINHQTNRLSLAALENRSRTSGFFSYRRGE